MLLTLSSGQSKHGSPWIRRETIPWHLHITRVFAGSSLPCSFQSSHQNGRNDNLINRRNPVMHHLMVHMSGGWRLLWHYPYDAIDCPRDIVGAITCYTLDVCHTIPSWSSWFIYVAENCMNHEMCGQRWYPTHSIRCRS